jgi:hypothetical protein
VASELHLLEQRFNADLVDSSYMLAPQSEALVNFRDYYLVTVRRTSRSMTEVGSDYRPGVGTMSAELTSGPSSEFAGRVEGQREPITG